MDAGAAGVAFGIRQAQASDQPVLRLQRRLQRRPLDVGEAQLRASEEVERPRIIHCPPPQRQVALAALTQYQRAAEVEASGAIRLDGHLKAPYGYGRVSRHEVVWFVAPSQEDMDVLVANAFGNGAAVAAREVEAFNVNAQQCCHRSHPHGLVAG